MAYPLTKKQSEVYEYIRVCLTEKRYSPTLYEITDNFGFKNHSTAQYFVDTLIKKKWISRQKGSQIILGNHYF